MYLGNCLDHFGSDTALTSFEPMRDRLVWLLCIPPINCWISLVNFWCRLIFQWFFFINHSHCRNQEFSSAYSSPSSRKILCPCRWPFAHALSSARRTVSSPDPSLSGPAALKRIHSLHPCVFMPPVSLLIIRLVVASGDYRHRPCLAFVPYSSALTSHPFAFWESFYYSVEHYCTSWPFNPPFFDLGSSSLIGRQGSGLHLIDPKHEGP